MKTKEQKLKERKLKLLEETLAYYEEDPSRRAIGGEDNTHCSYRLQCEDGTVKKCAIGRLIPDHLYDSIIEGCTVMGLYGDGMIYKVLPKEYSDLGSYFLDTLQQLHDFDTYWEAEEKGFFRSLKINNIKTLINTGDI